VYNRQTATKNHLISPNFKKLTFILEVNREKDKKIGFVAIATATKCQTATEFVTKF
jgi:hypothetical protein